MVKEIKLEQYYSGDKDWYDFVKIAKEDVEDRKSDEAIDLINALTVKLKNNEDLAYVIHYFFYESSLEWIERKIPVLDNISPLECLESESLTRRLREALLRTPL